MHQDDDPMETESVKNGAIFIPPFFFVCRKVHAVAKVFRLLYHREEDKLDFVVRWVLVY